jgi:hypothetical protein
VRLRAVPSLLALGLVLGACAGGATAEPTGASGPPTLRRPTAEATPTPAEATRAPAEPTPTPGEPTWQVGATPLPRRSGGFGQVRPTPPQLRIRRLPTTDLLAPPVGGRFASTISPIGSTVRRRMGETWRPGCPVKLDKLRYVTVSFRGFDGRPHTGELVVQVRVAGDVVRVFQRMYAARFPIEEMRLVTTRDLHAAPTGDGNNTAAFVCRKARAQTSWSAHAHGLAVDVNPFQNPYRRGDLVLPELASSYLDRSWSRPGMVRDGDVVTRSFAQIGWTWGGTWTRTTDRMHFSATGR